MRGLTFAVVLTVIMLPHVGGADLVAPHQQRPRQSDDEFLRPYIEELKKETPATELERICSMPEDQLPELHFSYGLWIRNKWLWGNQQPKLIRFFRAKGINHPDDMSWELIEALWRALDRELAPEQRIAVEQKRTLRARRFSLYQTISKECTDQLTKWQAEVEHCYSEAGVPADKRTLRHPSFTFELSHTGKIESVSTTPSEVLACVWHVLDIATFSSFDTDATLHLRTTWFPSCGVDEMMSLMY